MLYRIALPLCFAFAALAAVFVQTDAHAADEVFATTDGAIRGYDPVAYHTRSKAVRGDAKITHRWNGAIWRFASREHRDLFAADPERYAPRYGGFCAYGTSRGYKVSSDPDAFAVVDGKLYLNYSKAVQATWQQDRAANIRKADEVWNTLEHSAYAPPSR